MADITIKTNTGSRLHYLYKQDRFGNRTQEQNILFHHLHAIGMEIPQSHDSDFQSTWLYLFFSYPPGSQHMMLNICCPVHIEQLLQPFYFFIFTWYLFQLTLTCSALVLSQMLTGINNTSILLRPLLGLKFRIFLPKLLSLSCGSLAPVQLTSVFFTLHNNIRFCFGFFARQYFFFSSSSHYRPDVFVFKALLNK